jgi:hypothetical protein
MQSIAAAATDVCLCRDSICSSCVDSRMRAMTADGTLPLSRMAAMTATVAHAAGSGDVVVLVVYGQPF